MHDHLDTATPEVHVIPDATVYKPNSFLFFSFLFFAVSILYWVSDTCETALTKYTSFRLYTPKG